MLAQSSGISWRPTCNLAGEMRFLLPGLAFVAVVAAVHVWRSSRFEQTIEEAKTELAGIEPELPQSRTDLPPEIEAFTKRATASARPGVVVMRQVGEMRLAPDKAWSALTAEHTVSTINPAFVWHARVEMAPFLNAVVVDSFVGGAGRLEARLLGSVRVALATGPETDRAELMRYLGELAWTPEAILFNRALRWRRLSGSEFEVSAESSGGQATVRLKLNEEGDITQVEADDRPMGTGKESVPTPWRARVWDYADVGGFRIPRMGEVSWLLPEGEFIYWRGEVTMAQRQ